MQEPTIIFQEDELSIRRVDPAWDRKALLGQKGMFYLKDIAPLLGITSSQVKRWLMTQAGMATDTWAQYGLRKVWLHWLVQMSTFAPHFRTSLDPGHQRVSPQWSKEAVLAQDGIFLLSEVCRSLGLKPVNVRSRSKGDSGIFKNPEKGKWMVDMKRFAPWYRQVFPARPRQRGQQARMKAAKQRGEASL